MEHPTRRRKRRRRPLASRKPAWIYWPHPETKPEHFQPGGVAEVIAPPVPGLAYGDRVLLETTPDQARWEPEADGEAGRADHRIRNAPAAQADAARALRRGARDASIRAIRP